MVKEKNKPSGNMCPGPDLVWGSVTLKQKPKVWAGVNRVASYKTVNKAKGFSTSKTTAVPLRVWERHERNLRNVVQSFYFTCNRIKNPCVSCPRPLQLGQDPRLLVPSPELPGAPCDYSNKNSSFSGHKGLKGYWSGEISRGSSQPRDQTQVSCAAGRFFTSWAIRGAQEYWSR